jgi:phthalate 4,5-cis-dihydrodiol dehydrogenase
MGERQIALGVAGLGVGFSLMLPTLRTDPRLKLVAAADPRPEARARFAADFSAHAYETVDELVRDDAVEAVYIATPHQFHAQHAILCAHGKKHVLIEKPMAVTLGECDAMIAAAGEAGVHMVVGHSHSFDAPILQSRRLIASGAFGGLRLITAFNFTDFMYRPRRPEEFDIARGGGVVFNQGAHQVDVARLLAGGLAETVRAYTGIWDPARPSQGAYSAFITFAGGIAATLTYSGYAHFDSDEFCDWISETGAPKQHAAFATRRALSSLASPGEEAELKLSKSYGRRRSGGESTAGGLLHQHFGVVIASCEGADLRPLANGVMVYANDDARLVSLPAPTVPRAEVIDELYDAVVLNRAPLHSGAWGLATLEVCHAIVSSAREGQEQRLAHQIAIA